MRTIGLSIASVLLAVTLTACGLFKNNSPTAPSNGSDASITFQVLGSSLNGVLGKATITYSTPTGTVIATAVDLSVGPFVSPTAFSYGQFADITPSVSAVANGCIVVQILSNAVVVKSSDEVGKNCGMPANRSVTLIK
jgi:hypothetical protein